MTLQKVLPREKLNGSPMNAGTLRPSGKLWPTGEWSLGYARVKGDDRSDIPHIADTPGGFGDTSRPEGPGCFAPLDLRDVPNSHSRPRRGLKGITGHGRHMVKSVGALINRHYPRHRVTFATITLPPMPQEQRACAVKAWPEIVRQLLQYLSRKLERSGVPQVVCSVSEVQPKRLTNSGEGYLHLHLIWLNVPAKHGRWSVCPVSLSAWFESLLRRVVDGFEEGRVNVDVKRVNGLIACYMAKYMSKGSSTLAEAQEDWGEDVTPPTWYNLTAVARRWVYENVRKGAAVGAALDTWLNYAFDTGVDEVYAFLRPIEAVIGDREVIIGWRGRFHDGVRADLESMLQSLDIE